MGGARPLGMGAPAASRGASAHDPIDVLVVVLAAELGWGPDVILDLPWVEALRYHAIVVERNTPRDESGAVPSTLGGLHARIQGRVRGHG